MAKCQLQAPHLRRVDDHDAGGPSLEAAPEESLVEVEGGGQGRQDGTREAEAVDHLPVPEPRSLRLQLRRHRGGFAGMVRKGREGSWTWRGRDARGDGAGADALPPRQVGQPRAPRTGVQAARLCSREDAGAWIHHRRAARRRSLRRTRGPPCAASFPRAAFLRLVHFRARPSRRARRCRRCDGA